jgi:8-oxo-dGTP diphosphatase
VTHIVVGAAIVRAGRLLAQQRAYPSSQAGRWELPGGRVEPGESPPAALRRECLEELGVTVVVCDVLAPDVPVRPDLDLRVYRATLAPADATPRPLDHRALRWLTAATLDTVAWLPADQLLLPALRELLLGR